jgi:hypothetical protein
MEVWKKLEDYPDYEVSNLGRIKSFKRKKEKILKPATDKDGYLKVVLANNNLPKTFRVHQVVSIAFLNHIPIGMKLVVNHINSVRNDNRLLNLEIVTQKENINKKY